MALCRSQELKPFLKAILGGPSLAALLELEGRLRDVEAELRADELQVFGSRLAIGEIPEVAESDLILPRALMETMLSVLARFEREAGRAEPRRVVRSRGLLMMGRPGTGKTLTIGHILGRLAGVPPLPVRPGRRRRAQHARPAVRGPDPSHRRASEPRRRGRRGHRRCGARDAARQSSIDPSHF